jgi:hypothetical protein
MIEVDAKHSRSDKKRVRLREDMIPPINLSTDVESGYNRNSADSAFDFIDKTLLALRAFKTLSA